MILRLPFASSLLWARGLGLFDLVIIDLLWWRNTKRIRFSVIYLLVSMCYHFQGYPVASVAEKLILTLREQISHKMNKLPLRFFDGNKPGEILSRVTNGLDQISETLPADCSLQIS